MAGERDGQLVGEDVVLGFEVGGLEGEDVGERGGIVGIGGGEEEVVGLEELGQTRGREGVLGRDVEGWAGEAVRRGELGGEEEEEEELGFAGAAGGGGGVS